MLKPATYLSILATLILASACAAGGGPKPDSSAPPPAKEEPPTAGDPAEGADANSHLMVAEIALQRGDYPTAAREYAAAAAMSSDPKLADQATRVAFASGQNEAAAGAAEHWLTLDPKNADARRFLAVVALRLHRVAQSSQQFDELIKTTYPSPAEGFNDLGQILLAEDNAYGAYLVMQQLARKYPKVAASQSAVAISALRAYNYEAAIDSARRALKMDPGLSDADKTLARALVLTGKTQEGIERAREHAAKSDDLDAKFEVVLLLTAAEEDAAAREEVGKLMDVPDARPEALRTLATLELAAGNLDAAEKSFTELLNSGSYGTLAAYSLGSISERRKDEPRAVRYYMRVDSGPYAINAQLRAARLLAASGAREQANQILDDYVVDHPEAEVDMAIGRSRLLSDEGDAPTALELLDAARERYPDNEGLQYARAVTLERMERVDDSLRQLRDLLARRKDDPVAMNALGYTLAEHNRDLKEAKALIRNALKLTPDNPAVQDSMGWVQFRLGQNRDALTWLERAFAVEKDGEIAAHVGEVHWALGDHAKAREIWEKALEEDPQHHYLLNTMQQHPDTAT